MNAKKTQFQTLRAAFPHTIPVLTGYLFLGITYGMLLQSMGYYAFWPFIASLLIYGGSIQYAALPLFASPIQPVQAVLFSLLVNARHTFYGFSLLSRYKGTGKIKPFLIFLLSDETYSIICSTDPPSGISRPRFYLWISILNYSYWVIGSLIGGFLGGILSFNTTGLDFSLTALFIVILTQQMEQHSNIASCLIGAFCTIIGLLIFGQEHFLLPSMAFIVSILFVFRRRLQSRSKQTAGEDL